MVWHIAKRVLTDCGFRTWRIWRSSLSDTDYAEDPAQGRDQSSAVYASNARLDSYESYIRVDLCF